MSNNDNNQNQKPQIPTFILYNKYVLIATLVVVAVLPNIGFIAGMWDAAGNVVNNAYQTAKETVKDAADTVKVAVNHVADKGLQGIKDIAKGYLGYVKALDPWYPVIKQAAAKYNIDPRFVAAVAFLESPRDKNGHIVPNGRGKVMPSGEHKGDAAVGIMQIMPKTGQSVCGMGVDVLIEPQHNIDCGAKLLASLVRNNHGDYAQALVGYCGNGWDSALHIRTKDIYIPKVMHFYTDLQDVYPA